MIRKIYNAPCGTLFLEVVNGKVSRCNWIIRDIYMPEDRHASAGEIDVMNAAITQLDEYFGRKRIAFDLPLLMAGTPFRRKVWKCLMSIPYGKTMTYGEIAERCGCPGGQRAVAQACGANRLAILVPCHRVVRSDGGLGGYTVVKSGKERGRRPEGLAIKQYLLSHEAGCRGIPAAECDG